MTDPTLNLILSTLLNIIVSMVVSALVAAFFYKVALKDHQEDIARLVNFHRMKIQGLENGGFIEVSRDSKVNPTGIIFLFHPSGGMTAGGSSQPTVQRNVPGSGAMTLGGSAHVEVTRPPGHVS